MCHTRSAFLLFATFLISVPVAAQQPPQRDPHAILLLTQCLNASGGAQAFVTIQDYTASGTITYHWASEEVQGPAIVRARGLGQYRLDANLSSGVRSWAVNNGRALLKEPNQKASLIPYHNAVHLGGISLPFPEIAASLQDTSKSLAYLGLIQRAGRQAHRIRVQQNFDSGADPGRLLSKLSAKDFFVDAADFQLLYTQDMVHPLKSSTEDYLREVQFSDYRLVNGKLIPFSITEVIAGQQTWTIHLSQIAFNQGLTDLDFQL